MRRFGELTPREVLSLAIAIEKVNAEDYWDWSRRMLAYSTATTALFEEMAREERDHCRALRERYRECFGGTPLEVDPRLVDAQLDRRTLPNDHYFVFSDDIAFDIYFAALRAETRARDFYLQALGSARDPRLEAIFRELAGFEQEHLKIIEETMVDLRRSAQPRGGDARRVLGGAA